MNAPSLNVDLWGWKQGREGARGEAAPPSALIHQNSNNGIESIPYVIRDEFETNLDKQAVDRLVQSLPSHLRKKMFALRLKIEWMVMTYGLEHVGLLLTIV